MPGVVDWFSPFGEIIRLPGREISAADLAKADVLLVRSITAVNEQLLQGSCVRFVGSATIGTDHVDLDYLASRNIQFANAPGCNANAVIEYVLSCLAVQQPDWLAKRISVIGCGHVGGKMLNLFHNLKVDALGCDPFLDQTPDYMVKLDEALAREIICVHTPLTVAGDHPTFHLLNSKTLVQITDGALLINAGRGAVIDNQALLACLQQKRFRCALDVWENEPHINRELLDVVDIATPHIAGYSLDGKVAGTRMVFEAFIRWLGRKQPDQLQELDGLGEVKDIQAISINDAILQAYDVRRDDGLLKASPEEFDWLRKNSQQRLEFSHYQVSNVKTALLAEQLSHVGFSSQQAGKSRED